MPYQQRGETWRFQVCEPNADRVYLVRYGEQGMSLWTPMDAIQPGVWEAVMHLDPGRYRFAYFTCEGTAYFNGGTFGLCAQRVSEADPHVSVTPLPAARVNGREPGAHAEEAGMTSDDAPSSARLSSSS